MSSAVNSALNHNPELVRSVWASAKAVPIRTGRGCLSCSAVALRPRRSQTSPASAPRPSRQLVARQLNICSFITEINPD
jgi:hypothetical protein